MVEVFPNIFIGHDYWSTKNTDGIILMNSTISKTPYIISSIGVYEMNFPQESATWKQYDTLITTTTRIMKKYLGQKKTIQIIGTNYNDMLVVMAAFLINVSKSSLTAIMRYLNRMMNMEIDHNSNAMHSLIMYRYSIMIDRAN